MIKLGCYGVIQDQDSEGGFLEIERFVRFAYDLRLDVVDFHLGKGFISHDQDYLRHIKLLCLKLGLPIGYLGSGGGFVGTEEELRAKIAKAKADVDIAVTLGAPMIRLMGGRPSDDDPNPEATWSDTIQSFQEVADYAASKAISLGVQNHGPPARPRGQDILRILRDTGRDNVTHIMDTGQWWPDFGTGMGGDFQPNEAIYNYMEQVVSNAGYVRAKIYKIDGGREEYLDYGRVLKLLNEAGYNGVISIVYEGQRYSDCDDFEAVRLATSYLREMLAVS